MIRCQENPLKLFKNILREIIFDVYILSDQKKKITYITSSDIDSYFVEKIFGKDVAITKLKRIYLWELKKLADQQDSVLIDMYRLFARFFDNGFLVPPLVRQVLDIDVPEDKLFRINTKNLKKAFKYDCEVSNNLNDLKFFYEHMYIPHIKKIYGDLASVENFGDIEKIFKKGELLFIKLNGEYISAQLSEIEGNNYFLRKNGVLDESFVEEGALVATYYFGILRAKQINAKTVDFGQSRSFLSDGSLRHKSLWGTRICEDKKIKRVIYLRDIIFEQPFIYIEDTKLKAAVFSENDKLINEYSRSGLEFNILEKKMENKNGT